MDDPKLVITCIPTLVSVLLNREQKKGSPLTKQEVIDISNNATAIALPANVAAEVEAKSGYKDIPGINVWEEWQKARIDLI